MIVLLKADCSRSSKRFSFHCAAATLFPVGCAIEQTEILTFECHMKHQLGTVGAVSNL